MRDLPNLLREERNLRQPSRAAELMNEAAMAIDVLEARVKRLEGALEEVHLEAEADRSLRNEVMGRSQSDGEVDG
jgi:hypothetical protein